MECSTTPALNLFCFNNSFSVEANKKAWHRIVNFKNFLKQRSVTIKLHIKQATQNKDLTKMLHLKEC